MIPGRAGVFDAVGYFWICMVLIMEDGALVLGLLDGLDEGSVGVFGGRFSLSPR